MSVVSKDALSLSLSFSLFIVIARDECQHGRFLNICKSQKIYSTLTIL